MTSLIDKYLYIMKTQNEEIERLQKELEKQKNINSDLRSKKKLYKENCEYWKKQCDDMSKSVLTVGKNVSEALKIYEENKRG